MSLQSLVLCHVVLLYILICFIVGNWPWNLLLDSLLAQ